METLTYGAELEFADVLYGQPLPLDCHWNREDYSIVNSSGIANCPIGKYWPYGGEINTAPTTSIEKQVILFREIIDILDPKPVINYRCNLHIHVGIKGLNANLPALKRLLAYIDRYQKTIFQLIEPIPKPTADQYNTREALAGALKRYRRRFQSHQSVLKPEQVARMLQAKNSQEFYLQHFVFDKDGKPQKQLHQRCGINLRSLWENNETIEFRHFPGTIDPLEFAACVTWCAKFMEAALETNESPTSILANMQWLRFPKFAEYQHELEEGYKLTSHHVPSAQRVINIMRLASALV